ncbi:MAG: LysM peptidoglycan-binding domain-containing protein, partial [Flammeovirgaceae bacterium]
MFDKKNTNLTTTDTDEDVAVDTQNPEATVMPNGGLSNFSRLLSLESYEEEEYIEEDYEEEDYEEDDTYEEDGDGNGGGDGEDESKNKIPTHTVQENETLWRVAQQYENITPRNLRRINGLENNNISKGQQLRLVDIHIAKGGETIFDIAKEHKVRVDSLFEWNSAFDEKQLGRNFKIPAGYKVVVSPPPLKNLQYDLILTGNQEKIKASRKKFLSKKLDIEGLRGHKLIPSGNNISEVKKGKIIINSRTITRVLALDHMIKSGETDIQGLLDDLAGRFHEKEWGDSKDWNWIKNLAIIESPSWITEIVNQQSLSRDMTSENILMNGIEIWGVEDFVPNSSVKFFKLAEIPPLGVAETTRDYIVENMDSGRVKFKEEHQNLEHKAGKKTSIKDPFSGEVTEFIIDMVDIKDKKELNKLGLNKKLNGGLFSQNFPIPYGDTNDYQTVQYRYFDKKGKRLNVRRNVAGDLEEGTNEIIKNKKSHYPHPTPASEVEIPGLVNDIPYESVKQVNRNLEESIYIGTRNPEINPSMLNSNYEKKKKPAYYRSQSMYDYKRDPVALSAGKQGNIYD